MGDTGRVLCNIRVKRRNKFRRGYGKGFQSGVVTDTVHCYRVGFGCLYPDFSIFGTHGNLKGVFTVIQRARASARNCSLRMISLTANCNIRYFIFHFNPVFKDIGTEPERDCPVIQSKGFQCCITDETVYRQGINILIAAFGGNFNDDCRINVRIVSSRTGYLGFCTA